MFVLQASAAASCGLPPHSLQIWLTNEGTRKSRRRRRRRRKTNYGHKLKLISWKILFLFVRLLRFSFPFRILFQANMGFPS